MIGRGQTREAGSIRSVGCAPPPPICLRSVAARYQLTGPGSRTARRTMPRGRTTAVGSSPPQVADAASPLTRLEAILFLAKEPLNSRKLSRYANLADGTEARTLVSQLNQHYDQWGSAYRVESVAGGYQLMTRSNLVPWLGRLQHVPGELRLSTPALETLAVVAYRQPVLRAEIEAIRGVTCGEVLRQLMEQNLVRVGGRSPELGRPYLYITTSRFLQLFGLKNLEHLPRADQWRNPAPSTVDVHEANDTGES